MVDTLNDLDDVVGHLFNAKYFNKLWHAQIEFVNSSQLSNLSLIEQEFLYVYEALEKTLGVQNERLQQTADQLGEQFDNMKTTQEDINKKYQNVLDKMPKVYEPLLNQMITVSANIKQGQHEMVKDLQEMREYTQEINQALFDLGKNMPQEFGKAFELLNQTYIDKFNTSNQMLEKSMKEFTTAAAALITTSQVTQQN